MADAGYIGLSPTTLYALAGVQEHIEEHGEPGEISRDPAYREFLERYTFKQYLADGRIGPIAAFLRSRGEGREA